MATQFFTQPNFAPQLTNKAFPLSGPGASYTLQTGYMIWDQIMPGYSQRASIQYLYNPSTVSSDYNIADTYAQAALNFPNPGDTAMLAIPLSQTVQWSLMFDRTFELMGSYAANGLPNSIATVNSGTSATDAGTIGVQADVLAFMQFTGILANWAGGAASSLGAQAQSLLAGNSGVMCMWPSWAVFANSNVANGLTYYGFISEWSVQYTHWTQFNVPIRCVISVYWTMLPMPNTQPPSAPQITTLPNGQVGPGGVAIGTGNIGSAGIGGT